MKKKSFFTIYNLSYRKTKKRQRYCLFKYMVYHSVIVVDLIVVKKIEKLEGHFVKTRRRKALLIIWNRMANE